MANIIDNLNILDQNIDTAKTTLANNLTAKGVPATTADTLTAMADKVLTIPSGGGGDVEITECTALSITAKGAQYNQTTTQINYIAICKGKQNGAIAQLRVDGTAVSDDFGTNDTQENRTITISYTFKGKTATTEIIQKWNNPENPDLLEYEFSGSKSKVTINDENYTFTSSPVKVDLKLDLGINEFTRAVGMFISSNITNLITIPSTQNITSAVQMFGYSSHLKTLDLSGWNVQNIHNMSQMFNFSENLTTIDLSGWKINENTGGTSIFKGCTSLTTIYMRGCDQPTIDLIKAALTESGIPKGQVTIVTV